MTECCICLTEINKTTGQVDMSCSHKYHLKCISKWLSNHSTCPMCRSKTSEMETLESKAPTYGIGGNRMYSDLHSGGIGSRAIIYMQNYIQNYNYTWNESMIPTSSDDTDPQDTVPQDTVLHETIPHETIPHETIQPNEFPPDDIRLVAQQAGVGVARALEALRTTNGDIVNSILHLIQEI